MKWIGRIAKWIVGALLLLTFSGFVYEQVSRLYYNAQQPPESEFADVGGRKLHFRKEGSGNCTIVFESGLGGDNLHWQDIQKKLSDKYTTIAYDRAGILWSDYTDEISLDRYEADLSQLLAKTDCPRPYILVGHSFAGITLRKFIYRHAQEIQGVVFVDVTHPHQILKSSSELRNTTVLPPRWVMSFLNQIGVFRLTFKIKPFTQAVDSNHWFNTNVSNYFYKVLPGLLQEYDNDDSLMKEAEQIDDFQGIPLHIITAAYPDGVEQISDTILESEYKSTHSMLQKELLRLSSNSTQTIASQSGHYVTLQQPELIISAIEQLADKLRPASAGHH